jgi:hypothetical protein
MIPTLHAHATAAGIAGFCLLGMLSIAAISPVDPGVVAAAERGRAVAPPDSFLVVRLPGKIEKTRKTRGTIVGDVETETFATATGDAALSITATRLPRFVIRLLTDDILYRRASRELLQAMDATRRGWSRCKSAGFACRRLRYRHSGGRHGDARFFLKGDVLVVLNATYLEDKDRAERFLASASPAHEADEAPE